MPVCKHIKHLHNFSFNASAYGALSLSVHWSTFSLNLILRYAQNVEYINKYVNDIQVEIERSENIFFGAN